MQTDSLSGANGTAHPTFTIEELLRELITEADSSEGQSTWELSRHLNCSRCKVNQQIRILIDEGKVEVGYRRGFDVTGRPYRMPVYRLRKPTPVG
jgi:biotin operon repressor